MTIKEQIQLDFIEAVKSKNESAKLALSGIKAKITEAEKVNNTKLTDDEVISIINKGIKQRKESQEIYLSSNRFDLAAKEWDEIQVIKKYLPAQLLDTEVIVICTEIVSDIKVSNPNLSTQAIIGKSIGEFNKKYQGRADSSWVKTVISKLV